MNVGDYNKNVFIELLEQKLYFHRSVVFCLHDCNINNDWLAGRRNRDVRSPDFFSAADLCVHLNSRLSNVAAGI